MSTIKTYSIRYDEKTKEILLVALNALQQNVEQQLSEGNEAAANAYDQVSQVKRGILLAPGDEPEVEDLEEENSETVEESPTDVLEETPEEMYKSQDRPQ